ncbi:hypothetical protein F5H01DRAFT_356730 [Linnemannia elongata]|nr:hypothetical protein F5H01DRAFT_356730 [Linnemannia elongata]
MRSLSPQRRLNLSNFSMVFFYLPFFKATLHLILLLALQHYKRVFFLFMLTLWVANRIPFYSNDKKKK